MNEKLQKLVERLNYHRELYYNGTVKNPPSWLRDEEMISDAEFDGIVEAIAEIDPDNACIQEVGSVNSDGDVIHKSRMASLAKVKKIEDLNAWVKKYAVSSPIVWLLPKYDGLSCGIRYKNGNLELAATRGNGCLEYSSQIEFEDGRKLPIGKICEKKVRGKVKSYNKETGAIEYCNIISSSIKVNNGNWYLITVIDEDGKEKELVTTGEHQIFIDGTFTTTERIKTGDKVLIDI
ncbi:MAG: hypothetical protein M0P12_01655 [Paludibacteraceae bacterium]|nr:hypothetical protein [Paludibacteraceae bacterium]